MRVILAAGLLLLSMATEGALAAPYSGDVKATFDRACDLYEQSDFAGAIKAFEALQAGGIKDATLFYNLANSHYKQGDLGLAVANYRRALMLSPRDEDARVNLEMVRSVVGMMDTTSSYDLKALINLPLRLLSLRETHLIFYVCYYLSSACVLAFIFLPAGYRAVGLRVLIVLLVLAGAAYGLHRYGVSRFAGSSEGVVVAEQAEFRSGPGEAFDELGRLPDGTEVKIRAKSGLWLEVALPTGEIGWVWAADVVRI